MTNSAQKKLGYRELVYNINTGKFFGMLPGDNYEELAISTGGGSVSSGDTAGRPTEPQPGELYYDIQTDQLLMWNGSAWVAVSGGGTINVPSGGTLFRPAPASEGNLYYDEDLEILLVYNNGEWKPCSPNSGIDPSAFTTATLALAQPTTFGLTDPPGGLATQSDFNTFIYGAVPTNTSELTNDSGFITTGDVPDAYTKTEADARFININIQNLPHIEDYDED